MVKILLPFLCIILSQSCSLFKAKGGIKNTEIAFQNICLDTEGSGRIFVDSQNYIFNYESALFTEDLRFVVLMNFPLYGQEKFEMKWDFQKNKATYDASYEQMVLRSQKQIDLKIFQRMSFAWKAFYEDYLTSKKLIDSKIPQWTILKEKELIKEYKFSKDLVRLYFSNQVDDKYFGKMVMDYYQSGNKYFGIEFIVRKCM